MLLRFMLLVAVFFGCGLSTDRAFAERRVALVIGNSTYKTVPRLANPENDANAISLLLKKAGFDSVEVRQNLNNADMRRAMRDFSESTKEADIAIVFFAGHGIEVGGQNYLVPVDSALKRDIDVEDETVSLERVLTLLEPAKRLRLVILDACRENPYASTMARTLVSRSVGRGLAKIEPPSSDTLVAYAAKAGSVAADGQGVNSPFTQALLKHLVTPGLDVRIAFGRVRDDVLTTTNRRQEPFVYGALGGATMTLAALAAEERPDQNFVPPKDPEADVQASRDYEFAAKVGTREAWNSFLKKHPKGFYADLATAQRDKSIAPAASSGQKSDPSVDVQPALAKKRVKATKLVAEAPAESAATLRRKHDQICISLGNSARDCAGVCSLAGAACLRSAIRGMR